MVTPTITPAIIRAVKKFLKDKETKKNPVGRRPGKVKPKMIMPKKMVKKLGKVKPKKSKTTGYNY